ncbi:hypothetical protein Tco_0515395 [Tanacetum coccineum]
MNENENLFVPASMGYDHEMVLKSKEWVERLNPDSKLPNFNTRRVLVHERSFTKLRGNVIDLPTLLSKREIRLRSENYKAHPYQYVSPSKQILKAKAKPFPPCTHYGFNDHRPDDYRNYPKCDICGSYDHFTSGYNCVIHIRGGVLAESS